jgi:hypothetical protein
VKVVTGSPRRSAIAAVVLAAPLLASCQGNFNPATNLVYTPGVGTNDRSGSIYVLHAVVVSADEGSGTLVAGLANNESGSADTLTEIVGAGDDQTVEVSQPSSPIEIREGGFVQLADEKPISVTGEQVKPGGYVELTFSFDAAESVTLDVPVMPRTGEFESVQVPASTSS